MHDTLKKTLTVKLSPQILIALVSDGLFVTEVSYTLNRFVAPNSVQTSSELCRLGFQVFALLSSSMCPKMFVKEIKHGVLMSANRRIYIRQL